MTKPKKFKIGSYLIRLFEMSDYSHVFIGIKDREIDKLTVYHATGKGGVNFINNETFLEHNQIVMEFETQETDAEYLEIKRLCHKYAGDDYGFMQLVGILFVRFWDFFRVRVSNPWPMGKVCSEVAVEVAEKLGIGFYDDHNQIGVRQFATRMEQAVRFKEQNGRWTTFRLGWLDANKDR